MNNFSPQKFYSSKDEGQEDAAFGYFFSDLATSSLERSRDCALKEEMCVMWVLLCFNLGFSFFPSFLAHSYLDKVYVFGEYFMLSLVISTSYLYGKGRGRCSQQFYLLAESITSKI